MPTTIILPNSIVIGKLLDVLSSPDALDVGDEKHALVPGVIVWTAAHVT